MLLQVPWTSVAVLLVLVGCCRSSDQQQQQQLQESPGPVDASFINDLAKKPVKLDPKLRKALLKVLNRLEEEDKLLADATSSAVESSQQQRQSQPEPVQRQEQRQQEQQFQEQTKQRNLEDLQRRDQLIKHQQQQQQQQQQKQQQEQRQNFGAPTLSTLLPTPVVQAFSAVSATDPASQPSPTPAEPAAAVNGTATAASRPAAETTGTVVDFFEAPLLTAFTVQQDAAGVARRVIPIHAEPGQLERQKILELETRGAESDGGDRNTVEPDKRELEFLKNVELAQLLGPHREHGLAQQQQQKNEQRLLQQIQQQQDREPQRARQYPQPFLRQLQPQDQTRLQILQPLQPQLFQLHPAPAQQFAFGPFLQPELQQQQQQQQQLRVLRQPQQQAFGYGLPRLPGDLDVVYKVLALNHEGRNARPQVPVQLQHYNILLPRQSGSF